MHRNLEEVEFIIFDTETTGLDPKAGDRIVEIAAVKLKAGKKIDAFESLVNPQREISPGAFAVNHITQEMLEGAPDMAEIMPVFFDFIQGSCLCCYNAPFDMGFLNNELGIIGKSVPKEIVVIDILKMARRLMPDLQRHALWFVADRLGIKFSQQHRAMADVDMTVGVFNKFAQMLKQKDISDFLNFSNLFAIEPVLLNELNESKVVQIQRAMDLGTKIKIRYLSGSSVEVTEREVTPREIRREKNNIYLIGFCGLRNEERYFRVDGILHLEII
ncbi:MAG: exonuclease domain-containing protein [Candidatus Omnitrophota bacterium]